MTNEQTFRIQPYSKRELARMYFPNSPTDECAIRNFYNMVARCEPLVDELRAVGYNPYCKSFRAREVRIIVKYLEEP